MAMTMINVVYMNLDFLDEDLELFGEVRTPLKKEPEQKSQAKQMDSPELQKSAEIGKNRKRFFALSF